MANSAAKRSVSVILLGRMGFMPALDVQTRYAKMHLDELAGKSNAVGQNTLLLVEHTPAYTIGVRTQDYTEGDINRLKATGAEFYKTNRGGLITFHGPGQMVAYPILNLKHFKPSMKWYVNQLQQTLIKTLGHFDLDGHTTDQTGVWVGDRKIASIGLHGTRYITTHGISLNCNPDLNWFKNIVPCGLKGVDMTSISREMGRTVPYIDSIKPFLKSFGDVFDCELELRLLDEKELEVMSLPQDFNTATATTNTNSVVISDSHHGNDSSADKEAVGVGSLKMASEVGMRHMSTSTSFPLSSVPPPQNSISVPGRDAMTIFSGTPMW